MLLEDTDIAYDEVGNPIELRDWREASEWPDGSKPVTKKLEYDDLYRVRRTDYLYSTATGMDSFQSPFAKENGETSSPPPDWRRAKPAPHLSFANRPMWQRFEYDWLGNVGESDDDGHGFYDRSLGTQAHGSSGKPYQLSGANNSSHAASSGASGSLTTFYDAAGNLKSLSVVRSTARLTCLPSGAGCNQYYAYDWDEVGRLVRARRWDSTAALITAGTSVPTGTVAMDLRYRYDASDERVIKRVYDATAANQRHTLYVFGSLEVHRTLYSGSTYTVDTASLVPYAMANGVRLARLHYELGSTNVPQVAGTGLTDALGATYTASTLHVLLELGDHLGSTSTVLDKVSGELVEKASYLPFGAKESDYRPARWNGFREDYGFTGKEEDVEVGLTYFGKRFLSAQLGRWVSPDPLAVHAPGQADLNLYAYVSGAVLKNVDPVGLDNNDPLSAGTDTVGNGPSKPSTAAPEPASKPRLEPVNNRAGMNSQSATGKQEQFDHDPSKETRAILAVAGGVSAASNPVGLMILVGGGAAVASDSGRKDLEISAEQAAGVADVAALASAAVKWFSPRGAGTARSGASAAPENSAGSADGALFGEVHCPCFVADTPVAVELGSVEIAQIALGQRVLPDFAECDHGSVSRTERIVLETRNSAQDGNVIELLRPAGWLATQLGGVGSLVYLELDEVGISGWASVRVVERGPSVEAGIGCPVTGLFRHLTSALVRLRVSTGETITATPKHLLYSETRGWTPVGRLEIGESIRTATGSATVISLTDETGPNQLVFNLEVAGGHRYLVGNSRVLAHNQCNCTPAASGAPRVGGGGTLDKLGSGEVQRIQNAADRTGTEIAVVGSRVNPNKALHAGSDYDYVIDANSATRRSAASSLPGSKNIAEGVPGNQDIFKGEVDPTLPHVLFSPR